MSVNDEAIREQAREYLHQVAHHDDTNYGNVYVIEGTRIDGTTALDMAELALRTQQPIATVPEVTVAQALNLVRRVAEIEDQLPKLAQDTRVSLGGVVDAISNPRRSVRSKASDGEAAQA